MPLDLELIADGFSKPIYLCSPIGPKNDLYIVEQRGKIIRLNEKKESDNKEDNLNVSINYSEIFPLENNLLKEKILKNL